MSTNEPSGSSPATAALSQRDRRALYIFAATTVENAQHSPAAARGRILDRTEEALDMAGDDHRQREREPGHAARVDRPAPRGDLKAQRALLPLWPYGT